MGTSHRVEPLGQRWRCFECLGVSPGASLSQIAWFLLKCPERHGSEEEHRAVKAPHPSHRMHRTEKFMWCSTCGAWGTLKSTRALLGRCPGRPIGLFHEYSLSRLRRGLAPIKGPSVAAPREEYVLEVV